MTLHWCGGQCRCVWGVGGAHHRRWTMVEVGVGVGVIVK